MIRTGCLLLVLGLCGLGCLSSGTHVETEARQTPAVRMPEAPPPITADQVNEANVSDSVQALERELDSDSNNPPATPALTPPTVTKQKP